MKATSGGPVRRPDHRLALQSARVALRAGAPLPTSIPELIRRSWIRSRMAAVPMNQVRVPFDPVTGSAERLLDAAQPILDRFSQHLADTGVGVLLADRSARIVGRWAGDPAALRWLARVSIDVGSVFAEDLAGTNGIGTALEELTPVTIVGSEHYAETLRDHACVGVPIRHPLSRRIEGAVALACTLDEANGLLMPTLLDLCAQIEREMSIRSAERERVVFDEFIARNRMTNTAIIALSDQYMVTNAAAANLLGPQDQALLWDQAVASLAHGRTTTREIRLAGGESISARCTPVLTGTRAVGVLIEARPDQKARPFDRDASPDATTVSEAAIRLNRNITRVALSPVRCIRVVGPSGSGKSFVARRIHELRQPEAEMVTHPAGLASVRGSSSWLKQLEALLGRHSITIVVTNVDSLNAKTRRALADLLSTVYPRENLVVLTHRAESAPDIDPPLTGIGDAVLDVPPLRNRREDIPALARVALAAGGFEGRVAQRAMAALVHYQWPGNIAELHSTVKHAAHNSRGAELTLDDLSEEVRTGLQGWRKIGRLESVERDAIAHSLRENNGNKTKTADALGISRSTLHRRIRQFGLETRKAVL
jgi:transcriptional regulator of acetoin/glycerol metabolism